MRSALRPLFWPLSLLLAAGACDEAVPRELTEEDVAEIRRIEQEFVRTTLAGDVEGSLSLRAEDALWMAPGARAAVGREQVRAALAAGPPLLAFVVSPLHTEGRAGLAYNRGEYSAMLLVGSDTVRENGKYVQIWRRGEDGRWRIALDIFNSDDAPPD